MNTPEQSPDLTVRPVCGFGFFVSDKDLGAPWVIALDANQPEYAEPGLLSTDNDCACG